MIAFTEDSIAVAETRCDQDGSYELVVLAPEPVKVLATDYNDVSWWVGGDSFAEAQVFDLHPGDQVTGVDGAAAGFRLDLTGPGHYLAHEFDLRILDEAGDAVAENRYYSSPVSVCNLPPGRYFVQVDGYCQKQTWAGQWYPGVDSRDEAMPIDLAAGEYRRLEMSLDPGGTIAGEMRNGDGDLVAIDNLGVFDAYGEPVCVDYRNWRDFQDGRFSFPGLANGTYLLGLRRWSYDYEIWWYPGTWNLIEAVPLLIEDHGEISGLSWPPYPEEGASHD